MAIKWTEEKIKSEILRIVQKTGVNAMPSCDLIVQEEGNFCLAVAISKNGGYRYWAKKLGFDNCTSCSSYGKKHEELCFSQLVELGYDCQTTSTKYPYDILAGFVKIDVKSSRPYNGKNGAFYSFNLEKSKPTCDIFICYCIGEEENIDKIYVIPSCVLQGKTQLSIGMAKSKYDKYIDAWDIVEQYEKFFKGF